MHHIILENLKEYGYQGLDSRSKAHYLLNGIRSEKWFSAVATVKAQQEQYEKDFDSVIAFLMEYIDKPGPTLSVKVASVALFCSI